jgi:uncharacterized protein with von Willebrand factor type A (vWA) domain
MPRQRNTVEKTEPVIDTTEMELESKNDKEMIQKLMEQMNNLQKQVEEQKKEKTDLQQLVEVLKEQPKEQKVSVSKKVKIVSLIPNRYNLTTESNGHGKQFSFNNIGDIITIKVTDLEDILSIPEYRKQAEEGWFYILDKDVVADQDLTDCYEKIHDEKTIEHIMNLSDNSCVDMFVNLSKEMRQSLASKMAENMNNGIKLDRNRLSDINARCGIDIEEMAKVLNKTKN